HRLEFEDGFADDNGNPNPELPTMTIVVTLNPTAAGTRMAIETTFESVEAMEQILAMGAEEGMKQAMAQIEGLLADMAQRPGDSVS
ncbi:MAG: SRPBCC domain-containing protein, partial [Acidimicrobiia bacterium]